MAINCQTFSLVCLLLISTRGAAIVIVNGDREGHRCGQLRRRQWRAWSRLVRQLLRHKFPPSYRTMYIDGAPAPTEAIRMRGF